MRASLAAGAGAAAVALVVVALTGGIGGASGGASPPTDMASSADARIAEASGREVFVRMGCGSCHTLAAAGSSGSIGPNLDTRLPGHTRASLIAKITAPPSTDSFSAMPTNFGGRMTARELDALVGFLLAAR
jgi:mono/diheme cytochrome c family protein